MHAYDACATYWSFLGCSSLLAAKKRADVATNCSIYTDLVSEWAHTHTHTAYVSMKGLEGVHDIESVHVYNGCIDAELVAV